MSKFSEHIENIVKPVVGYTLVAIVGLAAGFFISLNVAGKSSYLEVELGKNRKISILKPDITSYDYKNLPEYKASAISAKLKELEWDDALSVQLRNLRDLHKGPFKTKVIDIFVKFTNNNNIKYPAAGGYRGDLLNQELSLFRLLEPENLRTDFTLNNFQVLFESPIPIIDGEDDTAQTIWINKKYACKWLHIQDERDLPDRLKVKAGILRRVVTLPAEELLLGYLSDGALY
jgi:hypothetical protein